MFAIVQLRAVYASVMYIDHNCFRVSNLVVLPPNYNQWLDSVGSTRAAYAMRYCVKPSLCIELLNGLNHVKQYWEKPYWKKCYRYSAALQIAVSM